MRMPDNGRAAALDRRPPAMAAEEWALRLELAACYRLFDWLGWSESIYNHITLRVPEAGGGESFLINPYGLHYCEVTAGNLVKIDAAGRVLTLVQYTRPRDTTTYVNSMWEQQREPYKGDVINSYNDGPPAPGAPPLGPFYELETSSPALALNPGERYTHVHRTFHLVGPEAQLDGIARRVLNIGLAEIVGAFEQ